MIGGVPETAPDVLYQATLRQLCSLFFLVSQRTYVRIPTFASPLSFDMDGDGFMILSRDIAVMLRVVKVATTGISCPQLRYKRGLNICVSACACVCEGVYVCVCVCVCACGHHIPCSKGKQSNSHLHIYIYICIHIYIYIYTQRSRHKEWITM
jgi:hypothetical protein